MSCHDKFVGTVHQHRCKFIYHLFKMPHFMSTDVQVALQVWHKEGMHWA